MSDRQRSIRAPLLDRLIDESPGGRPERPPLRVLKRNAFAKAVVRDLVWLLNTRAATRIMPDGKMRPHTGTVIDYGVEDFSHLVAGSYDDRQRLAKSIRNAIKAYEPRLEVHRLTVEPVEGRHLSAAIYCEAWLVADEVREPVSFNMRIDTSEGKVELDGR